MSTTMLGATLPGDATVSLGHYPVPIPGPHQVLIRIRASGICGSDLRCAFFEHTGVGAEAYQGVIAGHEPAGEIVEVGSDVRGLAPGDRVTTYHIAGCGQCGQCRLGYVVACTGHSRAAYGWQRDGGHAEYMLAEASSCIVLPDALTFVDGALVACGVGTAYEALTRARVNGDDRVLVTGLGPVGMAAGMLAKALGASEVIGVELSKGRLDAALELGVVDRAVPATDDAAAEVLDATEGAGVEVAVDCSGAVAGRRTALAATRDWGRCVLVGEGGSLELDVSHDLIHRQITLIGSWVTSVGRMGQLVERLARWQLAPDRLVSHRFPLRDAGSAYQAAAARDAGKVVLVD